MMRNWRNFVVLGAAFVVVSGVLIGPRILGPARRFGPSPRSMLDPPIYQGAQNLNYVPRPGDFGPKIMFTTSDVPAKVMDYYSKHLEREGWTRIRGDEPPNGRSYKFVDGIYYSFTVIAETVSANQTSVTLLLQSIPPID